MALVVDSNIVIDALNGVEAAATEILSDPDCAVSIISWIEVLAGCRDSRAEDLARQMLATLTVATVDQNIAEEAVRIRQSSRLKLPDALVLATARSFGCVLSTRNTKDFSAADPTIRIPYEL